MKRIISLIMVLALTFSLGFTAFADETVTNGSITITNATLGEDYSVYKIFNATHKNGSVSYTITPDSQFYPLMFDSNGNPLAATEENKVVDAATGKLEDGNYVNRFFTYNKDSGDVIKSDKANDSEVINYIMTLINENEDNLTAVATKKAEEAADGTFSDTITFDQNITPGYYAITSTLGTIVTINSATPHVTVVDKNQQPGEVFEKSVLTKDAQGNLEWSDENSANIGDEITYKIDITATNYDGEYPVEYYQIHDTKGDALWAEFNTVRVYLTYADGTVEYLEKGYYLYQGELGPNNEQILNTNEWEFLGVKPNPNPTPDPVTGKVQKWISGWEGVPAEEKNAANADWYFVHLTRDSFRVTIPWMDNYTLESSMGTDADGKSINVYNLEFAENSKSLYDSPVTLTVEYDAVIEYNANIGGGDTTNLRNEANATWISGNRIHTTSTEKVETFVYGLGIHKVDQKDGASLAGAVFSIYSNPECTDPVYVIPTDIEGVYILDSIGRPIEDVSGDLKETARGKYAAVLAGTKYADNKQYNEVVTPVNGKVVIKGLEKGTYYIKETKAPESYNAMSGVITMNTGDKLTPFYIFADGNGKVANITSENGTYGRKTYNVDNTTVYNSQGVELPETGGTGAMRLITFGTIIAIAFAALLITHKKMTVYED